MSFVAVEDEVEAAESHACPESNCREEKAGDAWKESLRNLAASAGSKFSSRRIT